MEASTQTNNWRKGLYLADGGTLDNSRVTLGGARSIGVFVDDGQVRRSALTARTAPPPTTAQAAVTPQRLLHRRPGIRRADIDRPQPTWSRES